ncbi:MAG TPA: DUF6311 domain-containing protein [Rudaea sp.]|nr:DUF6311 domain-containing protein [Rudaea sp.]
MCALLVVDEWSVIGHVAGMSPRTPGLAADRVIVCVCATLVLLACVTVLRRGASVASAFFIGALSGAGFFAASIGTSILDPTATSWLLRGADWTTHYAGWAMFRNAPWEWPPGVLHELMYPRGTAIIFTDSLPIVSLLLKPFSAWLPDTFQFTGGWFALCCVLQGGFGALLAQRWTRNPAVTLAASAMFLYAPAFLHRMPHATLMAQWLILASLWLYFRPTIPRGAVAETWPWWTFALIAAGTMPYLAAMVLAIFFAYCVRRRWVNRERSFGQVAAMLFGAIFVVVSMWWISGAMVVRAHNASGGVSHGVYSFNLLGFFNSYGWSMLLPGLPVASPEQMEGYSYLGLGLIALLVLLVIEALVRLRRPHWPSRHWPLLVVTLLTVAFAASTVFTIGAWTLIDYPLSTPLFAAFRSSGRFVWIAYYLTILALLVFTVKRFGTTAASVLLTCAFALQAWDYTNSHRQAAHLRDGANWPPPMQSLDDPGWNELAANRRHLTLIPPPPCGDPAGPILPFQLVAARNRLTFNSAYVARWNPKKEIRYCNQLSDQLAKGDLHDDELYVVTDAWLERFQHSDKSPTCRMLDGFRACVVAPPR